MALRCETTSRCYTAPPSSPGHPAAPRLATSAKRSKHGRRNRSCWVVPGCGKNDASFIIPRFPTFWHLFGAFCNLSWLFLGGAWTKNDFRITSVEGFSLWHIVMLDCRCWYWIQLDRYFVMLDFQRVFSQPWIDWWPLVVFSSNLVKQGLPPNWRASQRGETRSLFPFFSQILG